MPISINGTGSITGLSAGGLPDASIVTADIADGAITASKVASGVGVKLLQVVRSTTSSVITCSTLIPWDNTIPQNNEGTEVLTASISPLSSTSTLHIKFIASGNHAGSGGNSTTSALFVDSNVNAIAANGVPNQGANWQTTVLLDHAVASGGTSSRTYKIRVGANYVTFYINGDNTGTRVFGGVSIAKLEIWEVEA